MDYTAFVEAGESLVRLLRGAMSPEPVADPEQIALCSPLDSKNNQLTVFLFHVELDANSTQAGYYNASPGVQRIRPTYFGLYYLITAHSKAPEHMREADQYRLIGAATQAFLDFPSIPAEYATESLRDAGEQPRLSLQRLTHEQILKIWNSSAVNYKLSIVCKMEGVAIESRRERKVARVGEIVIGAADVKSGKGRGL
jgi:hypothetical protein